MSGSESTDELRNVSGRMSPHGSQKSGELGIRKRAAELSPLRAVLESFENGAPSVAGIASDTGLSVDLVQAVMDQLIRMGKLRATPLSYGCPTGASNCGSCSLTSEDGSACASGPGTARGPVLIELIVGPPRCS